MQAHTSDSPVIWPIVSGNVPERDVEYSLLPAHIVNATQPLRYRTDTHARSPTCMHTDAITLTPSTRMQAHMYCSPVKLLIAELMQYGGRLFSDRSIRCIRPLEQVTPVQLEPVHGSANSLLGQLST